MNAGLNTDKRPWYREPWPWLLMLGPAIVVAAGIYTAYLAVISNDGLVEDDYYKQGLTVNQRTVRDHRAGELGIEADLILANDRIRAMLRAHAGVRLPATLMLHIAHPTKAGFDQHIVLSAEGDGLYGGRVTPLHGRWHVVLEDATQEWRVLGQWVPDTEPKLRLQAPAGAVAISSGSSVNKGR